MTIKRAKEITGGLSNPRKMPCKGFNLPAGSTCPRGRVLRKQSGTVCSKCYACKGRYVFPSTKEALRRRHDLFCSYQPEHIDDWQDAMITQIKKQSPDYFRWHDSGDVFSKAYGEAILYICSRTPNTKHWIPTHEKWFAEKVWLQQKRGWLQNVCVRLSAEEIGHDDQEGPNRSCVDAEYGYRFNCPAYKQGGHCGDCRTCWDRAVETVNYPLH